MEDPLAYLLYLNQMQQAQSVTSIFDTFAFWIVIIAVVPVLIKFLFVAKFFASLKGGMGGDSDKYKPGPMGALGPFFGYPAVILKSQSEIEHDRGHSYKKWGSLLSAFCIVGGIFLFTIGVSGAADVEINSVVTLKNAAPGTILFVIGFLIWKNVHK